MTPYEAIIKYYGKKSIVAAAIINDAESVDVISYKRIPVIKKFIDKDIFKAEEKLCFSNAARFSMLSSADYHLGLSVYYGIWFEHAWNSYKGEHFDLTLELTGKMLGRQYFAYKKFTTMEVMSFIADNNTAPDIYNSIVRPKLDRF